MRRLSVIQLLKASGAFALTSTVATDTVLLLADRLGAVRGGIPGDWYVNGPLFCWAAVAVPVSIHLAGRMVSQARATAPTHITGHLEGDGSAAIRAIPFNTQGAAGRLFAHSVRTIGEPGQDMAQGETYRPARWRVTINGVPVTVRESELRAFLDLAYKRDHHQFSRPYWTRKRRPPLYRAQYDAYMALLTGAGLVDGRHGQGGASGRLVTFPREAILFLKHQSAYRVA